MKASMLYIHKIGWTCEASSKQMHFYVYLEKRAALVTQNNARRLELHLSTLSIFRHHVAYQHWIIFVNKLQSHSAA